MINIWLYIFYIQNIIAIKNILYYRNCESDNFKNKKKGNLAFKGDLYNFVTIKAIHKCLSKEDLETNDFSVLKIEGGVNILLKN